MPKADLDKVLADQATHKILTYHVVPERLAPAARRHAQNARGRQGHRRRQRHELHRKR
jgi:uncharacterized surface protein with fasciclin (FAS1) repeats